MNIFKSSSSLALAALMLLSSCASSVKITSSPSGADVYADGFYVGQTPMRHKDAKPTGTTLELKLEKEGYDAFERVANVPPRAVGPRSLERLRVQALELGEGMLHAAAHAKSPVPARAASNLKVFTDALDELRELQEATSTPIPAEEGHAGPLVGSMAWFLLEVLVCLQRLLSLRRARATPPTRRPRRAAVDA